MPSHSLEDFPVHVEEIAAASLIHCFSAAWHPRFLARTETLPKWHRADVPPAPTAGSVVFVPTATVDWLPHGWLESWKTLGLTAIEGGESRGEVLAQVMRSCESGQTASEAELPAGDHTRSAAEGAALSDSATAEEFACDFLALGHCYLQLELLARQQRHYTSLPELAVLTQALAASRAWVAGDFEAVRQHLATAFEKLHETREKFHPNDCYLIDLCLLDEHTEFEKTDAPVGTTQSPVNVLVSGMTLGTLSHSNAPVMELLRAGTGNHSIALVGGEYAEIPPAFIGLRSLIENLRVGLASYQDHLGTRPTVWGRRVFGLCAQWPQLLKLFEFRGALHLALDDGIYPDEEFSRMLWKGSDGTGVRAFSRIPLPADTASGFLKLPARLSESMDHDDVASGAFARWPKVANPWMDDLRRIAKYAPVLGKFVTLAELLALYDSNGQTKTHTAGEYWPPQLLVSVAEGGLDPLSRYDRDRDEESQSFAGNWVDAVNKLLGVNKPQTGAPWHQRPADRISNNLTEPDSPVSEQAAATEAGVPVSTSTDTGDTGETIAPQAGDTADQVWKSAFDAEMANQSRALTSVITRGGAPEDGWLLLNPSTHERVFAISSESFTQSTAPLSKGGSTIHSAPLQVADPQLVTVPGMGFCWLPKSQVNPDLENSRGRGGIVSRRPLAEGLVLQNEFFEAVVNSETGGLARLRLHNSRRNRLSQQVGWRFPRVKTTRPDGPEGATAKTFYANVQCQTAGVVFCTSRAGVVETTGVLTDPETDALLASFTQRFRIFAGAPRLELEIELRDLTSLATDPWNNYVASRFAWNSELAAVTRSVLGQSQPFTNERFESAGGFELADEGDRTSVITNGAVFHRMAGGRMLDSLLHVKGERTTRFNFTICLDEPSLGKTIDCVRMPMVAVPADAAPSQSPTGWLFHIDQASIQLVELRAPAKDNLVDGGSPDGAMVVSEAEGLPVTMRMRMFRAPSAATKTNLLGTPTESLQIEGDAIVVPLHAFEVARIAWNW